MQLEKINTKYKADNGQWYYITVNEILEEKHIVQVRSNKELIKEFRFEGDSFQAHHIGLKTVIEYKTGMIL